MKRRQLTIAIVVFFGLLAFAARADAGDARDRMMPDSALAQCSSRCQGLLFIDQAWCLHACRCATNAEFCPPPGPWQDLRQARMEAQ